MLHMSTINALIKSKEELKQQRDQLKNMCQDYLKRVENINTIDLPEILEKIRHINDDLIKAGEPHDPS